MLGELFLPVDGTKGTREQQWEVLIYPSHVLGVSMVLPS